MAALVLHQDAAVGPNLGLQTITKDPSHQEGDSAYRVEPWFA